jgi:signal transduction histidine kinase
MERALALQQPVFEEGVSPGGRIFENRIYPSETGLSIFFTDITEARRLHREVEAERRRLQRLAECVRAAIIMVSAPSGELLYSNRRASDLLNPCRDGLAATLSRIAVNDAESAGPLDIVAAVLRTGAAVPEQEISHVGGDGQPVTLLASAVPVEGEDGRLEGVVASFHDVTQGHAAREALRHLSRRLLTAQDEERRRISLDLHDDFAQVLTAVKMTLVGLRSGGESSEEAVRNAVEIVDRSIAQIRDLSLRLHPPMLDLLGLGPTLRWYVEERLRNTALRAHLSIETKTSRFGSVIENACFRVVQEAVTNVLRHAEARELSVQLRKEPQALHLTVRDDGRGFDLADARARAVAGGHAGLAGMQERVALAGGALEVCSKPAAGTEVRVRFVLEGPR